MKGKEPQDRLEDVVDTSGGLRIRDIQANSCDDLEDRGTGRKAHLSLTQHSSNLQAPPVDVIRPLQRDLVVLQRSPSVNHTIFLERGVGDKQTSTSGLSDRSDRTTARETRYWKYGSCAPSVTLHL